MRYMGIDYGTKKLGIAFSDEEGNMAFPHDVIPNTADLIDVIESLVTEQNVSEIVIGHSIGLDGADNKVQKDINTFIGDLTLRTGLPVHLEPEQYSTQEAIRFQGRNEKTDASAAAIILNSFLLKDHD